MAAVPPPVVFALDPASAITGIIDMKDKEDLKVYDKGIKPLFSGTEKYDCEAENMMPMLNLLGDRAREQGWSDPNSGILHIPRTIGAVVPETDNLLEAYGIISLERIREFEESYIDDQVRAAQDTNMLYKCLMKSMSKESLKKLVVWRSQYMVGELPSGNLLLKVIIRESHLDSNATTSVIRLKLGMLDKYMPTINSAIPMFHQYVQILLTSLASRGETTNDLLINLFKGYGAASDRAFRAYAAKVQDDYDDGENITAPDLMIKMENKYKALKIRGLWDAPSEDEEKIMVLEARQTELQSELTEFTFKKKSPGKTHDDKGKGNGNSKAKRSASAAGGQFPEDPDWLTKNIKPDKLDTVKTLHDKTWNWCCVENGGKCGGKWRRHDPKECRGTAKKTAAPSAKKLRLAHALATIAAQGNDSDDDDE